VRRADSSRRNRPLDDADGARDGSGENRVFIIFLDDYHTRASTLFIRKELAKWVSNRRRAIWSRCCTPLDTAIAATFSRDHDGTAMALMNFQGRKYSTVTGVGPASRSSPETQEQIRTTSRSVRCRARARSRRPARGPQDAGVA
jgi:hypothetical protein